MAVGLPSEHSTHKECEPLIHVLPSMKSNLTAAAQSWTVRRRDEVCLFANGVKNVVVVQTKGHVQLFAAPWTTVSQDSLSITNSWSLLKLVSIESMMPSNHLILPRECIFGFWVTWSTLSPTTQKIRFSWKSLFSFSLFGGRFRFTWILECIFL